MFKSIIALVTISTCTPVFAQQTCVPHEVVVERLAEGYGEHSQYVALDNSGNVVETFANLETGSWTLVVTQPGGPTCLIASGNYFQYVNEEVIPGVDG